MTAPALVLDLHLDASTRPARGDRPRHLAPALLPWAVKALAALAALVLAAPASHAAAPAHESDCMIEAAQTVEIRSPVVGLLQRVHARRGEFIRQGQVLVTIESSAEQSAAESAKARAQAQGSTELAAAKVGAAREKVRRLSDLLSEEFVSAQAVDDARAELQLAEAELKTSRENTQIAQLEHRQAVDQLRRRQILAPFSGVVVDQYLYPGAMVDAGEGKKPVLKIAQVHPLAVQALLPVRLFSQLRVGQTVTVTPEAPFTRPIQARVRVVDRVIDAAAGSFGIVADLDNSRGELPAGLRCRLAL